VSDPLSRIAELVRVEHLRARRAFFRRLAVEQARIARVAREDSEDVQRIFGEGGPRVVERIRARLDDAEVEQGRNILDTIENAPSVVVQRMNALTISVGRAIPDRAESLPASYLATAAANRGRTRDAFEPYARFRARIGPAREATIAQVRTGLEAGASVRQIALDLRAADAPPPVIPAYVQGVVSALAAGGVTPGKFQELASDVRAALRGMGSATNAQSWRTIRPTVERLARAVESGNVDRVQAALANYVETKMRFEAGRIARTESARAASAASTEQARRTPGVMCMQWVLSSEHPVEDICDVYARADLYGFGPGRYPLDRLPELPAHPNCLCSLSPVLDAQSILRSIRGEPHPPPGVPRDASPEAWLLRQPAAQQARVVGSGAAALMRGGASVFTPRGTVRPLGAIRSPG
jgi:hypothetical protein